MKNLLYVLLLFSFCSCGNKDPNTADEVMPKILIDFNDSKILDNKSETIPFTYKHRTEVSISYKMIPSEVCAYCNHISKCRSHEKSKYVCFRFVNGIQK